MIEDDNQPITVTISRDVALVLDALFERAYESGDPLNFHLMNGGEWGAIEELAGKIESNLYEVFLPDYGERVNSARKRLQEKHGWPVGHEPTEPEK
ncbi:MAG: hypothetical protein J0I20_32195 [Chloroflexi bacterium]|nr:hypothetical protein [Chloroflexota bacterium]OJV93151.1 MAG: hypothetical protein BGO39_14615 [Chloroflexi bacterium 54-19]